MITSIEERMNVVIDNYCFKQGKHRVGILASGGKESLFMLDTCLPTLDRRGVAYNYTEKS